MWHLDTDTVVAFLRGNQRIANRLKELVPEVAISSLVLAELLYGARASARVSANLARVNQFMQVVHLAQFDRAGADAYSQLQVALRRRGCPTGGIDALIAATALANDAILVTHNTRHYENIDGLTLDDWMA